MKKLKRLSIIPALIFGFSQAHAAPPPTTNPLYVVTTTDGQSTSCIDRLDEGKVAYRVTNTTADLKNGKVEIKVDFETLKCAQSPPVLGFTKSGLDNRIVNPLQGFMQFKSLELVTYTPDLKVTQFRSIDVKAGDHSVTFVADIAQFTSLYPRNVKSNQDFRIGMTVFLRGIVLLGDARTGGVVEQTQTSFGAYAISVSTSAGTLRIALRNVR